MSIIYNLYDYLTLKVIYKSNKTYIVFTYQPKNIYLGSLIYDKNTFKDIGRYDFNTYEEYKNDYYTFRKFYLKKLSPSHINNLNIIFKDIKLLIDTFKQIVLSKEAKREIFLSSPTSTHPLIESFRSIVNNFNFNHFQKTQDEIESEMIDAFSSSNYIGLDEFSSYLTYERKEPIIVTNTFKFDSLPFKEEEGLKLIFASNLKILNK